MDRPQHPIVSKLARIKRFRGQVGFTGIHEYFVPCPWCREPVDFPTMSASSRFVELSCPVCEAIFLGEAVRSNSGIRANGGFSWDAT